MSSHEQRVAGNTRIDQTGGLDIRNPSAVTLGWCEDQAQDVKEASWALGLPFSGDDLALIRAGVIA